MNVASDLNDTSDNAKYYDLGINLTSFNALVFRVKGNNTASLCLTATRLNAAASCPGYQVNLLVNPNPPTNPPSFYDLESL